MILVLLLQWACASSPASADRDGDGYPFLFDCDDRDPTVHPGAVERWYDGRDADCDGNDDDQDGDGYPIDTDCDDADFTVHPGAPEICDGRDNDCDWDVDGASAEGALPWPVDADGDGFGGEDLQWACSLPEGCATVEGDCDDGDATVFPGAPEVDDSRDQDCDGLVDEDLLTVGDLLVAEISWGAWVEVGNLSARQVDLGGFSLWAQGAEVRLEGTLSAGAQVVVDLDAAPGPIVLRQGARVFDRVPWDWTWPAPVGATTLQLDPAFVGLGDLPTSWCLASATPGEPNLGCHSM